MTIFSVFKSIKLLDTQVKNLDINKLFLNQSKLFLCLYHFLNLFKISYDFFLELNCTFHIFYFLLHPGIFISFFSNATLYFCSSVKNLKTLDSEPQCIEECSVDCMCPMFDYPLLLIEKEWAVFKQLLKSLS